MYFLPGKAFDRALSKLPKAFRWSTEGARRSKTPLLELLQVHTYRQKLRFQVFLSPLP